MMNRAESVLLRILGTAIGGKPVDTDLSFLSADEWKQLIDLSFDQGVDAISVDGYHKLLDLSAGDSLLETDETLEDLKFEWFGSALQAESDYQQYLDTLTSLVRFYSENGIKTLLLKGYDLSLSYPTPSHRATGDIDVYLYGQGGEADRLLKEKKGIETKQNEDKHSTFQWNDTTVENHACFINDTVHPYLKGLEDFFEKDAENAVPYHFPEEECLTIYLPSPMTNALFLPYHIAVHFVHGEASLRQLCDWACFLRRYGREINWHKVETMVKEYGYYSFYSCLNAIVKDYLGVPKVCLPSWDADKEMEEKVLTEILHPKYAGKKLSLAAKVKRYFSNRWKYKMVYKDSMLLSSIRQAKSYIRLHDKNATSIWEIKN